MIKMHLVGTEKSSVHMRCAIVSELLDELSTVPLAFFHASSAVSVSNATLVRDLSCSV
jgi:hypothetical protein